MIARLSMIAGGLVWCAAVFGVTSWVTFPSDAVVDRLAYSLQESTDGGFALKASTASPWWIGLNLSDVELLKTDKRGGEGALLLDADRVSARTSIFSAFSTRHPIVGSIVTGGATIPFESELDRSGESPRISLIRVAQAPLAIGAIGGLLQPLGANLTGTGEVVLDVDLSMASDIKEHEGRVALKGRGLAVTVSLPDPFGGEQPFQLGPVSVATIDLDLEVRGGKVTVRTAELRSDHANLVITGDLSLDPFPNRSRLRGKATISELGGTLATFESFLGQARWDDGTYRYLLSCSIDRIGPTCFRPDRPRSSPARAAAGLPRTNRADLGTPRGAADDDAATRLREERAAAREQRLAERRAQIEASRAQRPGPLGDDDLLEDDLLDEPASGTDLPTGGPLDAVPVDLPELRDPLDVNLPPGAVPGPNGEEWE